ncbi:hypothetical protein [Alloyangia pacifica]|uniref:Uncharacterized protein n=1 Tax=Alloyangia pacifica TaxID=311180 RepID=A0A1I6QUZ8_9RHOB|nr:hypothetical protein [Alloyangia pacifica]SDG00098.1 hypothetical protein SAMN04488245_101359 [Alloyangia pacifica]SFS56223.1 hypothetical protein SAMN04488050_102360 [Alloyangia pacifica]
MRREPPLRATRPKEPQRPVLRAERGLGAAAGQGAPREARGLVAGRGQGQTRRGPRRTRRRLARVIRALPLLLSLLLGFWALTTNPFAQPFLRASEAEVRQALDAALARTLTPGRLEQEIGTALEADDLDRIDMLLPVAARVGVLPDAAQSEQIAALREEKDSVWGKVEACGICAADIAECPSLQMLAYCGIPLELTPIGDLNALRRAGGDYFSGADVDEVEVTLATVGLAATGTLALTGGTSATVKAGATALRMGRRLRTLTPSFLDELARLADPAMLRRLVSGAGDAADTARLARAEAVAGDVSRVVRNTSMTDGVLLLRHVDSAEDAARLARVSQVAGSETRGVMEVLGKSRTFRALVRLSDHAIATAALLWLAFAQALTALGGWLGTRLLRPAARGMAAHLDR